LGKGLLDPKSRRLYSIKIYKNEFQTHFPSLVTCQTLMNPSLNPAKSFFPRGFQVRAVHTAGLDFLVLEVVSFLMGSTDKVVKGFSESLPKSQTLTPESVAALTHCNLGLN